MSRLTGGNWEARANDYWIRWHRSARIAAEDEVRREHAERALREIAEFDAATDERCMGDGDEAVYVLQDIAYRAITGSDSLRLAGREGIG